MVDAADEMQKEMVSVLQMPGRISTDPLFMGLSAEILKYSKTLVDGGRHGQATYCVCLVDDVGEWQMITTLIFCPSITRPRYVWPSYNACAVRQG